MFERFTQPAREAIVRAKLEAEMAGSRVIELQFLLLGVIATAEGPAGAVLRDAGFVADDVRTLLQHEQDLGDDDAAALKSIGIDLDAVRASLEGSFGAGALGGAETERPAGWLGRLKGGHGHTPFAPASKKALEFAVRHAVVLKDSQIGAEHLLLGVLTGAESDAATRTLVESRLPVAELKARLIIAMDAAA